MAKVLDSYPNYKYVSIADDLRKRVIGNQWEHRLPSIAKMAVEYGVTVVTMQRSVDILKDQGYVYAKRNSGIYVSGRHRQRTNTLGLVIGSTETYLGGQIASGVQNVCQRFNQAMIVDQYRHEPNAERDALERFAVKGEVDGIVYWASSLERDPEKIAFLKDKGLPFVLVPEPALDIVEGDCNSVGNYDSEIAAKVLDHLLDCGHRKIGFITEDEGDGLPWSKNRYSHYSERLLSAGLEVFEPIVIRTKDFYEPAELSMNLNSGRTAFFCATDRAATVLMRHCLQKGIRVPEDIAIAGYDNSLISRAMGVTSVDQNFELVGELAAELLIKDVIGQIKEPTHLNVESELIVRHSTLGKNRNMM